MRFENKVALITGAAVGIGRGVAVKLAQEGAKLVLADINLQKLQDVKKELEPITKDVIICQCDVSVEEQVNSTVAEGIAAFGKIDILVNNAAIWRTWKPFVEIPTDEWKRYFDINVMSVVYFTKAVLPGMIERNYGRIVNVASVAGVYGNANMSQYSATKAAVISMTKAIAKEVADKGILVNVVSPGTVSPSEDGDLNSYVPNELNRMGRTGSDMENANLIAFLASDEGTYISGQNIQIDGCRKSI